MQLTKEELALIAAIMVAVGAAVAAVINLFSSSRSKYVDTITLTRIAWVKELRSDFADFLSTCTKIATQDTHKLTEEERYKLQVKVTDRMLLLGLKVNRRSRLDREIFRLIRKTQVAAIEGTADDFTSTAAHLAIVSEELLKEEWEKAKYEASGLIRKIHYWWRKIGREDARKQRRKRWLKAERDKSDSVGEKVGAGSSPA